MGANTGKLKACFHAVTTFLGNVLTLKFPLWLFLVAFLVCVLVCSLVACGLARPTPGNRIESAVVGFTEYHGHSYLVFSAATNFSVIHDPECICYKIEDYE